MITSEAPEGDHPAQLRENMKNRCPHKALRTVSPPKPEPSISQGGDHPVGWCSEWAEQVKQEMDDWMMEKIRVMETETVASTHPNPDDISWG